MFPYLVVYIACIFSLPLCLGARERVRRQPRHYVIYIVPSGCQRGARASVRCLFQVLATDPNCRILNLRVNAVFPPYWRCLYYHFSGTYSYLPSVSTKDMMSITQTVLTKSPEPEAHDKVFDNNPDRIGIWKCWF